MATKVSDWCWIGDWQDASRFRRAVPDGRIVTVANDSPVLGHYVYPVVDGFAQGNDVLFFEAMDKIVELKRSGRKVLVHCVSGISRSPAALIGASMKVRHIDYDTAYGELRELRPSINPHPCFVALLKWNAYQRPAVTPRL